WSRGKPAPDLPACAPPAPSGPRDTYVFFISGAKERNPAAAMALIERLQAEQSPLVLPVERSSMGRGTARSAVEGPV
ncbi:MAG: hypothetical protein QOH86_1118, partial [Sphingomonadales bacterium]|nr:hypothetical protein [Sphingomonadales bacterium]